MRQEEKEEGTRWVMGRWEKEPLLFAKQVPVLAFMETVPSWCNETGLADTTVVLDAEALDVRWQWFPTDTGVNTRARRGIWSYPVFACDQSAKLARTECVKWRGEGTAIISDCGPRSANTCWSSNAGSCCQWDGSSLMDDPVCLHQRAATAERRKLGKV